MRGRGDIDPMPDVTAPPRALSGIAKLSGATHARTVAPTSFASKVLAEPARRPSSLCQLWSAPRSLHRSPRAEGHPTRVLLVARDRRYRAVASTLLSQRGNTVLDCRRGEDVDRGRRARADRRRPVRRQRLAHRHRPRRGPAGGAVSADRHRRRQRGGPVRPRRLPVLPKWTAFDEVFAAIERARRTRLTTEPPVAPGSDRGRGGAARPVGGGSARAL